MTTPEGEVKEDVKRWLDFVGAWYFMPAQWGYGRRGVPDFIGVLPGGRMFAIECKSSEGEITALQKLELTRIEQVGGLALVATPDNNEELRVLINGAIEKGRSSR